MMSLAKRIQPDTQLFLLKTCNLHDTEDGANFSRVIESPFIVRFSRSGLFSNTVQDNEYLEVKYVKLVWTFIRNKQRKNYVNTNDR